MFQLSLRRIYILWGRMNTCICMAESLHCSLETITTLLIGCIPIQNKKLKKKHKNIYSVVIEWSALLDPIAILFEFSVFLFSVCLFYLVLKVGVLKSPTIIVLLSISPFNSGLLHIFRSFEVWYS